MACASYFPLYRNLQQIHLYPRATYSDSIKGNPAAKNIPRFNIECPVP